MFYFDLFALGQVGDGPGDFENFMITAGRELETGQGLLNQLLALAIQRAVFFYQPVAHFTVEEDVFSGKSGELDFMGRLDLRQQTGLVDGRGLAEQFIRF